MFPFDVIQLGKDSGQAFHSVVFALYGNDDALRGDERIACEWSKGRRAIHDNEFAAPVLGEEIIEAVIRVGVVKILFGFEEVGSAGNYVESGSSGRQWCGVRGVGLGEQRVAKPVAMGPDTKSAGCIGLWVEVYEEYVASCQGESSRQVYGGCGLADAAFLISECQEPEHL